MAVFFSMNMSMVVEKVKDGAKSIILKFAYLFLALLCFLSREAQAG